MKLKNLSIVLSFVILTFTFSCSDESSIQETNGDSFKSAAASDFYGIDTKRLEKMKYFKAKIMAGEDVKEELVDYAMTHSKSLDLTIVDDEYYNNLALSIIDDNLYECDPSNIPFNNYVGSTVEGWTGAEWFVYYVYDWYSQLDAIYFKDPNDRQKYGVNGEYSNKLNSAFKDLKRFWDIYSDDIGMVAMKGETFSNYDVMLAIEVALYPDQTLEESMGWVDLVMSITAGDLYWNNTHPLLSFNAFALSTPDPIIKDRIVMGDGIMDAYTAIGMDDVAPQAILAHEFGHHIQFENGYFDESRGTAEGTRRTELMADAYAAYYLTHKRGATMNWWRVQQFLEVFYNIGDCQFDSSNHHGTYNQRLAAAQWGYDLANNSKVKGKILTSDDFFQLFEEDLDDIINCDTCLN